MVDQADELARLITAENGKALADARGEVLYSAEFFRWYAEEAVRIRGDIQVAPGGANKIIVLHQPVGVAVLVTPWNFPAAMAARKIAPALAAGCTVILKPASETPLTALAIAALIEQAGIPAGVVNVLPSRKSAAVVSAMLADPRVRKLSFTGSTAVGRTLMNVANEHIVNCSMELGGNAPFVVFDDADLDAAIEGAMIAKMRNGGEACTAANRFYVAESIADEFADQLTRAMGAMVMGPGAEPGVTLGPLVNASTRNKVAELVDDAVTSGASVTTGGTNPDGPGFFYPPTVLTNVSPDAAILQTEIFGPVAPIVTFSTEQEAIELANGTEYGLVAYVYTATSPAACGSARRSRPAWSASTADWCPTPPHRSGASKKAASVAKVESRASSPSPKVSTSPSTGDSDDDQSAINDKVGQSRPPPPERSNQ